MINKYHILLATFLMPSIVHAYDPAKVNATKSDIINLQNQITALKNTASNLQNSIQALQSSVNKLNGAISVTSTSVKIQSQGEVRIQAGNVIRLDPGAVAKISKPTEIYGTLKVSSKVTSADKELAPYGAKVIGTVPVTKLLSVPVTNGKVTK